MTRMFVALLLTLLCAGITQAQVGSSTTGSADHDARGEIGIEAHHERPCGSSKSITGPTGMTPVGLIVS